jgi:hypothetical protein
VNAALNSLGILLIKMGTLLIRLLFIARRLAHGGGWTQSFALNYSTVIMREVFCCMDLNVFSTNGTTHARHSISKLFHARGDGRGGKQEG